MVLILLPLPRKVCYFLDSGYDLLSVSDVLRCLEIIGKPLISLAST